jgi:hypothetical protein
MSFKHGLSFPQLWGLCIAGIVTTMIGLPLIRSWGFSGPMQSIFFGILGGLALGITFGICALIEKWKKK